MDIKKFWKIIELACRGDPSAAEQWHDALVEHLARLPAEKILEFDRIFDRLAEEAYTMDLWGAAYCINGGASDDGFYYFRCWLICMGQRIYEGALADPDTLADIEIPPELDAEAETYAVAQYAWSQVTGKPMEEYGLSLPARHDGGVLKGDDWDFEDDAEMRRRLPRLAAKYLNEQ